MKKQKHPRNTNKLRSYLAKRGFFFLIFDFIVLIAVMAIVAALLLKITETRTPYLHLLEYSVYQLLGAEYAGGVVFRKGSFCKLIDLSLNLFKIILPAVFLGTIIFKLFIKKETFKCRKIISVNKSDGASNDQLIIRLYNQSSLLIVDVNFKAYLRVRHVPISGSPSLSNIELDVSNPKWPISIPHVPYSLRIDLKANDIEKPDDNKNSLFSIQGNKLKKINHLLILVKGAIPELGTELCETYWYTIPDSVKFGKYTEIDVDYSEKSKSWVGWNRFDENE